MAYLKELIDDECELQMTPMIDVVFLLLIFFLCTIKFKTLEGKLAAYLPKDVGVNTFEAEPKEKCRRISQVSRPRSHTCPCWVCRSTAARSRASTRCSRP